MSEGRGKAGCTRTGLCDCASEADHNARTLARHKQHAVPASMHKDCTCSNEPHCICKHRIAEQEGKP